MNKQKYLQRVIQELDREIAALRARLDMAIAQRKETQEELKELS